MASEKRDAWMPRREPWPLPLPPPSSPSEEAQRSIAELLAFTDRFRRLNDTPLMRAFNEQRRRVEAKKEAERAPSPPSPPPENR